MQPWLDDEVVRPQLRVGGEIVGRLDPTNVAAAVTTQLPRQRSSGSVALATSAIAAVGGWFKHVAHTPVSLRRLARVSSGDARCQCVESEESGQQGIPNAAVMCVCSVKRGVRYES